MLTYAFGDLHGRSDLLRLGLGAIRKHSRGAPFHLVFLGDYIDRGPASNEVIELLSGLKNEGRATFLLGNHEQMLLKCARGTNRKSVWKQWMEHGGAATLSSYGLDPEDQASATKLPPMHLAWLRMRPPIYPTFCHIFVHAGIDPYLPLHEQDSREFLWIRERFLAAEPDDFVERRHVVHGHSPLWEGKPEIDIPEILSHRTNLDTAAYETGLLTIGVFWRRTPGLVDLISVM